MKGLIVGACRAGTRHSMILCDLSISHCFVDTDLGRLYPNDYYTLEEGLTKYQPDFVVIATPPDVHLEQIEQCVEYNIPVLCEKPLCGIGQLERAKALPKDAKVAVAYNYRFYPTLNEAWEIPDRINFGWTCISNQHRDSLPEWGIILDHLSHTFDTLLWMAGEVSLYSAFVEKGENSETVYVVGKVGKRALEIIDKVNFEPSDKMACIICPKGFIDIPPSEKMFENMWKNFLNNVENIGLPYYPNLTTSIRVQELLEEATELAENYEG